MFQSVKDFYTLAQNPFSKEEKCGLNLLPACEARLRAQEGWGELL